MASPILPVSSASGAAAEAPVKQSADSFANKEVFLKLLVAQLQHQNPLNPMDGMQFVTQLAQFTELEQIIAIREGIGQLVSGNAAPAAQGQEEPQAGMGL
ncbi:MAG: hypothetical protein IT160_12855 [Bryobacterales bacterium]|nr:hypothetical protein [Bryobacterales bacterium]